MKLRSKLPNVGTTIFTIMSNLAQKQNAINLSQGFPDFDAPESLLERVTHHLRSQQNQYAPMTGRIELREAIAEKVLNCYDNRPDASTEITVCSGATEALFCAIQAFVGLGDEVIMFDPAYDSYEPAVTLAGGRSVHIPLTIPGFRIDWNQVSAAISNRTSMIILNSPHNPSGAIVSEYDMIRLAELTRDTDIVILGDEVYEHIVFDNQLHHSLLRYPELRERSLVVSSFGKTFHMTGWKIGYCVAPATLTAEFRKVHQFVQFTVVTPMQLGIADFLNEHPEHYQGLHAFYQEKRDHFCRLMQKSRFRFLPSSGTYFQMMDYSDISMEPDMEFVRTLTCDFGVAAIPMSVFYADVPEQHMVRFCFAKNNDTLEQAAEKLCLI